MLNAFKALKGHRLNVPLTQYLAYAIGEIINTIETTGERVEDDVINSLTYWRDNHSWFASFTEREPDPDFIQYLTRDPDFRNRFAFHYLLIYGNYFKFLHQYKENAEFYLEQIRLRLDQS